MRSPLVLALAVLGVVPACHSGTPSGPSSGAAPALPPGYDLLFDGDAEGESRFFRVAATDLAVLPFAEGVTGNRARPSPDGHRIVAQSTGTALEPPFLQLLDESAGAAVRFEGTTFAYEREATWSPDGRRIAFTSDLDDPTCDIFVADVVGTALVGLTNLTAGGGPLVGDVTPAWSPDGRWIAFTSYRGGDVAIWKMRPDGTDAVPLTSGEGDDYFPSWSPDGRRIAFQRNEPQGGAVRWRLWIVPADGGPPALVDSPDELGNPAWHPEAELIAVVARTADGERDVRVVAPDGAVAARVPRAGVDRHPAWLRRAP